MQAERRSCAAPSACSTAITALAHPTSPHPCRASCPCTSSSSGASCRPLRSSRCSGGRRTWRGARQVCFAVHAGRAGVALRCACSVVIAAARLQGTLALHRLCCSPANPPLHPRPLARRGAAARGPARGHVQASGGAQPAGQHAAGEAGEGLHARSSRPGWGTLRAGCLPSRHLRRLPGKLHTGAPHVTPPHTTPHHAVCDCAADNSLFLFAPPPPALPRSPTRWPPTASTSTRRRSRRSAS